MIQRCIYFIIHYSFSNWLYFIILAENNEWVLADCFHQMVVNLFILWLRFFLEYVSKPLGGEPNYSGLMLYIHSFIHTAAHFQT